MNDIHYSTTNPWMVSTLLLIGLVVGFGVAQVPYIKSAVGTGAESEAAALQAGQKQAAAQLEEPEPEPVLTADQIEKLPDDDMVMGEATAPITVVEFSDFQCPFCSRFWTQSFGLIDENYIKTGKVKFIYRDFPLDSHPQSQMAAEAAECADEQGKFREMHDMIFVNQLEWSQNPEANKAFKGYAAKLGLTTARFDQCLDSGEQKAEVRKDLIDGVTVGVTGTPSFFINGKSISGAMPYEEVFKPIFEAELRQKEWKLEYDPATRRPVIKVP